MRFCNDVSYRVNKGIFVGGHCGGRAIVRNVIRVGIWCPTLHNDAMDYARSCDIYQCTGKPSQRDEMSLVP